MRHCFATAGTQPKLRADYWKNVGGEVALRVGVSGGT